jgi:acetyl-CoA carboxylase biotin carboxyl carrier protein
MKTPTKKQQRATSSAAAARSGTGRYTSDDLASDVEALARVLREYDLSEIDLERGGERIRLRREPAPQAVAAPHAPVEIAPRAPAPIAAATAAAGLPEPVAAPGHAAVYITSPFVGTFYRQPSPDAPPFVEVGAQVRKGKVLCIIEAMKLMNEIEAEVDGTIVAVLAENGQPVEYGEPLFQIRP